MINFEIQKKNPPKKQQKPKPKNKQKTGIPSIESFKYNISLILLFPLF